MMDQVRNPLQTGAADADSVVEQKKLEARKMLEKRAECPHLSGAPHQDRKGAIIFPEKTLIRVLRTRC